jgi:hypothetical protein
MIKHEKTKKNGIKGRLLCNEKKGIQLWELDVEFNAVFGIINVKVVSWALRAVVGPTCGLPIDHSFPMPFSAIQALAASVSIRLESQGIFQWRVQAIAAVDEKAQLFKPLPTVMRRIRNCFKIALRRVRNMR